jgi:N-formylglutamate amidohydrolase
VWFTRLISTLPATWLFCAAHSFRVEVNRNLYMNKQTRALIPNHAALRQHLLAMVQMLQQTKPRVL